MSCVLGIILKIIARVPVRACLDDMQLDGKTANTIQCDDPVHEVWTFLCDVG